MTTNRVILNSVILVVCRYFVSTLIIHNLSPIGSSHHPLRRKNTLGVFTTRHNGSFNNSVMHS